MIKVHFRALKPEESPARWSERVFCESVAFRDMASPYLSGWRENRYGPESRLHNDHDHSKCRHRAKFEANGVKICGRHLNTLCTELIFANQPLDVTFENMEPTTVLATVGLNFDIETLPTAVFCGYCHKKADACECSIKVDMTAEGLKMVGSPCWPIGDDEED